ncbi:SlyX family protein [Pararhodobacter sp.]|uniref:SlyX family protein n=1 Tax=Pararhodobacter sp. TaxID=2127056 RepID=UPI002FDDBF2B
MTTDRMDRIEEQIAHLTRATDDMSDILRAQSAEIARLRRLLTQLTERETERGGQDGTSIPLADQRPPHW